MKNFKKYLSFVAIFALLFTSCSKDENEGGNLNSDKATLSFGAIVNDLANNRAATKQSAADLPDCSDDNPAYVRIVLMDGNTEVVGTSNDPYKVNLASGQIFTVEDPALELDPGMYTLSHFAVYNANDEMIWLAPRAGSALADYVNVTLPLNVDLRAGVKKYVDVSVLCFDDREVNEYGYLFFELDTNVALTYCFFANYCDDDGRHFPARYNVSIWHGTDATGTQLYSNVENTTGVYDNGDFYATPLCFALPDNDDVNEEYLYYEITLLDWDDAYGDVESRRFSGTITKKDIMSNYDGNDNTEYHHVRFCGDGDVVDPGDGNGGTDPDPGDGNGGTDPDPGDGNGGTDPDPGDGNGGTDPDPGDGNGGTDPDPNEDCDLPAYCTINIDSENLDADCYFLEINDANADGYVAVSGNGSFDLNNVIGDTWAVLNVSTNNDGSATVRIDGTLSDDRVTAYSIEIRPTVDGVMSTTCWESQCANTVPDNQQASSVAHNFDGFDYSAPFYVRVSTVICGETVGTPD